MVRAIYSVLIQNEKSLNSFNEFNELFVHAINRQQIGICKWNEAGTDMETALPDLIDLVDEKEEWRAVIVLTEHDESEWETARNNPFDFAISENTNGEIKESGIPLIRLTHILGGIPAMDMEFECEKIVEPNKEPRMIYKPVRNPEKEAAYKALEEKYAFSGKRPSEIIIVSVRDKLTTNNEDLKNIWETKKEINSSDFWKKNNYPSICRFLVFDLEDQGSTQRYSDMFNFWMSILLIITNHINANVLQAYRLYSMETTFDKDKMKNSFQKIVFRLFGAQQYIKETIALEEKMRMLEERNLPDYSVEIPVTLDLTQKSDYIIDPSNFTLVTDDRGNDFYKWESLMAESEEHLRMSYRMADRKLDEAAAQARTVCKFPEDYVYRLSEYQQEDMEEDLKELYDSVIKMQSKLPDQKKRVEKNLRGIAKKVRRNISMRIKRRNISPQNELIMFQQNIDYLQLIWPLTHNQIFHFNSPFFIFISSS